MIVIFTSQIFEVFDRKKINTSFKSSKVIIHIILYKVELWCTYTNNGNSNSMNNY